MNNKNQIKKNGNVIDKVKASFSGRKFRSGAYATALSMIVIVIVLVVNLIVSKMDITFDMSETSLYTISQETKDYLANVKDDITIYYMVQKGNETDVYEKIIKQYDKVSDKITVEKKDYMLYPQFASNYVNDEISDNSFIVVNNANGKAKYIDSSELLVQEMNYNTYQSETTGIDVEGKLTAAILYVTSDDLPVLYTTSGHGEVELSNAVTSSLSKMNVEIQNLATLTSESIPKDCDLLFINSPEKDFTEEEAAMIKEYLTNGGKAIITMDYMSQDLKNFSSLLDYYGVEMVKGMVVESDANMHMANYPTYLVPSIESHDITSKANDSKAPVFMPMSSGLLLSDSARSSLTLTPLLATSEDSFSKVNLESKTAEKEQGDIAGPFYLGVLATDTYNDVTSDLAVFSSEYTFSEDTASYGNLELLTGTVGYLIGDTQTVSIPSKSIVESYISPTAIESIGWGLLTAIGVPLTILIIGIVVCLRRRKK